MRDSLYILILALFCSLNISCGNQDVNDDKARELELRERELALKERELELREKELTHLKKQLAAANKETSLAEIYMDVKRAVYLISTKKEYGNSQGSAFVIHPSGLAISNYHVFKNASEVIVYNENNEEYMVTEIIKSAPEEDYILFRIGPNNGDLPYVDIADAMPAIGTECFTVGNPKGLTQSLSDGLISAYRENHRILQTTTEITHGSSGGPLFNQDGEVIGITSSGYQKSNLNFAINIESLPLSDYLKENTSPNNNMSTYDLLHLLGNYYKYLKNGDLDQLSNTYNDNLRRYHKLFNINKYQAISDQIDYFKRYDVIQAEIIENSVDIQFSGAAYFVTYQLDWTIEKKSNGEMLDYRLETVVEVDPNGCINSIYDNILKRED